MRTREEFLAMHTINVGGYAGYRAGDGITRDVVERLGLTVGVDVRPANADVVPRPAGNARRADWEAYALGQGLDSEEIDSMSVTDLRNRFPEGAPTAEPTVDVADPVAVNAAEQIAAAGEADTTDQAPARNASKSDWVAWVMGQGHDLTEDQAKAMTRDQLADAYGPKTDAE